MLFKCLCFFPSQYLKSVNNFESLSLKHVQGYGVVYLTVLVSCNKAFLNHDLYIEYVMEAFIKLN